MVKSTIKSGSEARKLRGNTRSLLENLRKSRREATGQLRKDLAQARSIVKSDVRQMLGRFQKTRRDSRLEFKKSGEVRRGSPSAKPVESNAVETPLISEAPSAKEETPGLETKVLAAVNEHPEGINLAGVAEGLGVATIVLGRASKSLLDKGEVRKEGKLYFSAAGEGEAGKGLHFRPPFR